MLADASLLEINATFVVEIIAFIFTLLILGRWVYPKVIAAAEQRQNQIEAALKEAEANRLKSRQEMEAVQSDIEEAKQQAKQILDQARREAAADAEASRKQAKTEAEALVQRARGEIEAERSKAVADIRNQVGTLVVAAASRVLGESIDAKAHRRLIDETLKKMEVG